MKKLLIAVFCLIASILGMFGVAHAATTTPGQAFTISPPLLNIKGDPGKTITAQIKLTNISQGSLDVETDANDFGAKDESGDPNIILDTTKDTPYTMHSWVQLPDTFTLASKETKSLSIPIVIPKNAEPGGHYAVIRFSGSAPGDQQGVALSASIGTLVLLQVSGNIQEHASVADFYAATPKFEKSSFFEGSPITFVERIKNDGNVHVQPTGTVSVTDIFGKNVATLRVNGDPSNAKDTPKSVLPASVRRFDETLNQQWMFGRYRAHLALTYGDKGQTLTGVTTFWVIPYRLIIIVLVALGLLVWLIIWLIRRNRRNKVWHAQPK